MLVADVLQSCLDLHEPLDMWRCLGAKTTHEMMLQCTAATPNTSTLFIDLIWLTGTRDPNGARSRDMNEWEKLKRSCLRFAAIMRVLKVAVPEMKGLQLQQLVSVREPKVKDALFVGPDEEKELLSCSIVKGQEPQRFRLWFRDNCILFCVAHPSELQRVLVRASYGLNRLSEAGFANLPRDHPDRDRCLLLSVRPTVQHLEAAAFGKHAAISTLVTDEMQRIEIVFDSADRASVALELVRKKHAYFKEQQRVSLEKVLLNTCDLFE